MFPPPAKAEPPENELRRLHEAAGRLVGETQPRFEKTKNDLKEENSL